MKIGERRNQHFSVFGIDTNICLNTQRIYYISPASICLMTSQQTQSICIRFVQRRSNVFDVGPILYKYYANVLCLLTY